MMLKLELHSTLTPLPCINVPNRRLHCFVFNIPLSGQWLLALALFQHPPVLVIDRMLRLHSTTESTR